jgi:hypothetical protein
VLVDNARGIQWRPFFLLTHSGWQQNLVILLCAVGQPNAENIYSWNVTNFKHFEPDLAQHVRRAIAEQAKLH